MVALTAVVAGAVLLVVALRAQTSAPIPRPEGSIEPSTLSQSTAAPGTGKTSADRPLEPSAPRTIDIPAIGVHSKVNPIGLDANGSIAVPQPGARLDQAAWFQNSPTPGQPGPAIIEGHVDSESGPSVFYELGRIRPGERIHVTRADGTRLTFTVDAVRDFLKSKFPTSLVYGAKDLSKPALRLITCSQFDTNTHHHVGNAVVFAHLTNVSGRSRTP
jgi:sortase (surface protein transpeptidase)